MTKVLLDLKMNMLLPLNICPSIIYFRERKKPPQNQHLLIYWWRGQGRLVQIYLSSWTHLGVEETDSPSTLYLFMGEARLEEGVEEERAEVWASVCAWISQRLDWEGTCSAALLQSKCLLLQGLCPFLLFLYYYHHLFGIKQHFKELYIEKA